MSQRPRGMQQFWLPTTPISPPQVSSSVSKDAAHAEVRRLGNLTAPYALTLPAYADYLPGAPVEVVTSTDATGTNDKTLTADAPAGSNIVVLDERQNLNVGDVLRIGQAADPEVEYMVISAIPNRLSGERSGQGRPRLPPYRVVIRTVRPCGGKPLPVLPRH